MFEYMSAGIPVLASSLPEIHRLVNKYEIGVLANPGDHNSIRTVLTELLTNGEKLQLYRQNVQKARHDLSWQGEVSQLINAYSKIVK
jgi:glycosyltransferase involved in cell wall biosynthesis